MLKLKQSKTFSFILTLVICIITLLSGICFNIVPSYAEVKPNNDIIESIHYKGVTIKKNKVGNKIQYSESTDETGKFMQICFKTKVNLSTINIKVNEMYANYRVYYSPSSYPVPLKYADKTRVVHDFTQSIHTTEDISIVNTSKMQNIGSIIIDFSNVISKVTIKELEIDTITSNNLSDYGTVSQNIDRMILEGKYQTRGAIYQYFSGNYQAVVPGVSLILPSLTYKSKFNKNEDPNPHLQALGPAKKDASTSFSTRIAGTLVLKPDTKYRVVVEGKHLSNTLTSTLSLNYGAPKEMLKMSGASWMEAYEYTMPNGELTYEILHWGPVNPKVTVYEVVGNKQVLVQNLYKYMVIKNNPEIVYGTIHAAKEPVPLIPGINSNKSNTPMIFNLDNNRESFTNIAPYAKSVYSCNSTLKKDKFADNNLNTGVKIKKDDLRSFVITYDLGQEMPVEQIMIQTKGSSLNNFFVVGAKDGTYASDTEYQILYAPGGTEDKKQPLFSSPLYLPLMSEDSSAMAKMFTPRYITVSYRTSTAYEVNGDLELQEIAIFVKSKNISYDRLEKSDENKLGAINSRVSEYLAGRYGTVVEDMAKLGRAAETYAETLTPTPPQPPPTPVNPDPGEVTPDPGEVTPDQPQEPQLPQTPEELQKQAKLKMVGSTVGFIVQVISILAIIYISIIIGAYLLSFSASTDVLYWVTFKHRGRFKGEVIDLTGILKLSLLATFIAVVYFTGFYTKIFSFIISCVEKTYKFIKQ